MIQREVTAFKYGTIDEFEAQSLKDGAASASLNWLTKGDKTELRRGMKRLGTDAGTGRVSGLGKATRQDGTEVLFRSRARKLEYYDADSDTWTEIGSNTLPAAADDEDISFSPYNGLAGAQIFASSDNSSIYKIMAANPGSITDLLSTNHRGKIKIRQGRLYLWGRKGTNGIKDETALYRSKIDKDEVSDFTETTGESIGTGDGSTKTFSGTLAFKSGSPKKTCFLVRITDSTETFTDNKNGTLVGDLGGTGTINYTTGAYSVTFSTAPTNLQAITGAYYTEDSTSGGIADFAYSATRVATEGYVLRQDDGGGPLQNIGFYNGEIYCLHKKKTWKVTESADDLSITNLTFRELVGIPNFRAVVETGEGIYYIDDTDENAVRLRLLTLDLSSSQVVPVSKSDNLKLSDYRFDTAAGIAFEDFILFACRKSSSAQNDTLIVYNKRLKVLEKLNYNVSCFEILNGALVAGDSISGNVFELFSGFDDDDDVIYNYWEGNLSNLEISQLKRCGFLRLQGEIAVDQELKVSLSFDNDPFVEIGTISGQGNYVDRITGALIGESVLGKKIIGGGGSGVIAYNYYTQFRIRHGKFKQVKIRFEAQGIGYVSVSLYEYFNIMRYGHKLPKKYRQ